MYLYINTTLEKQLEVSLYDKGGQRTVSLVPKIDRNESETLLKTVDQVMCKCPCRKTDEMLDELSCKVDPSKHCITGIIVVRGPKGRFSAIRAGVTCANSLAFAWNIPVVGIESGGDVVGVLNQIKKFTTFTEPIIPTYEREPNIG